MKDLITVNETQASNLVVPPLGKHYASVWMDDEVSQDANTAGKAKAGHNDALFKKAERIR